MENWTSSVTLTWWTLPWMCTEASFLKRKFPIVSVDAWYTLLICTSPATTHTISRMVLKLPYRTHSLHLELI